MNYEVITSRNNQKIKDAASYKDGKRDYFLVEGFHMVEMAVTNNLAIAIFTTKEYRSSVKTYLVNEAVLDKLTSSRCPEGIAALCRKKKEEKITSKRVLLLDGLADPGNVGTITRSALAFGFLDIVLGPNVVSLYNSKALMASQGAYFKLNIIKSKDLCKTILDLKKENYQVFGTSLKSSSPLEEVDNSIDKMALILGNEGKGVSEEVLSVTDSNLRIEMDNIDSLNVAMAGAIAMHHFRYLK